MSNTLLEQAPFDESPVALGSNKRRSKRIVVFLLIGILATYIAFAPSVMPLYNTMLFYPFKYPHGHYGQHTLGAISREDVTFPGPHGTRLNGWFFNVPGATKTILFNHGQGGNLTNCLLWAHKFVDAGTSFFIYDYEGYGRSDGTPTRSGIVEDGECAYKYLTEVRHVPAKSIVDCGFSLGTGVASALAEAHPFAGLILIAPYTTLRQAALDLMPLLTIYPQPFWPETKLGSWNYVAAPHPPLLIIHGDHDQKINVMHSDLLYKRATPPKMFIRVPNRGHGDLQNTDLQSGLKEYLQMLDNPSIRN